MIQFSKLYCKFIIYYYNSILILYYKIIHKKNASNVSHGGEIFCCGANYSGQLGLGNTDDVSILTLFSKDRQIQNIICGYNYTIFYKSTGDVLVFGSNFYNELGINNIDKIVSPTFLMNNKNIIFINGCKITNIFTPTNYKYLNPSIQNEIKYLYYCLKKFKMIQI